MVHIDGRLLKFMYAIKSLGILPYDLYILIVLKAKDVRKNEIRENTSEPFTGRSTFAKKRRARGAGLCYKCGNTHHDNSGICRWWSEMLKFRNADRLHWIKYGLSNSDETPYRPTLQRCVDELIYLHFSR